MTVVGQFEVEHQALEEGRVELAGEHGTGELLAEGAEAAADVFAPFERGETLGPF